MFGVEGRNEGFDLLRISLGIDFLNRMPQHSFGIDFPSLNAPLHS